MVDYRLSRISRMTKGANVCGYYYLKTSELRVSNQNSRYLDMTFCDSTGEINAKMWNAQDGDEILYRAGTVVYSEALVREFQGMLQLRVDLLRRTEASEDIDISSLVPTAPVDAGLMYGKIEATVASIKDPDIKKLLNAVLAEYGERFKIYPAAKSFHHSVRSGLLYHTYTMLLGAEQFAETYKDLKKDLLFAGVILHDVGKIEEMTLMDCGLVSDYTTEGELLGHIISGICIVDRAARAEKVDPSKALLIKHMILSHHYEAEYGSPKKPAFPEAEILHYLDVTDSRMYDMFQAVSSTESGKFSEHVPSLEKRKILNTDL